MIALRELHLALTVNSSSGVEGACTVKQFYFKPFLKPKEDKTSFPTVTFFQHIKR